VADRGDITRLLNAHRDGNPEAMDHLAPLIYDELRRMARRQLRRFRPGATLCTTALIHETWLELVDERGVPWRERGHFFAVAALTMRRVVVDRARYLSAAKRGGDRERVDLARVNPPTPGLKEEVLAVDMALDALEDFNPRLARVVECRWFAGMTAEETAEAVGVSSRTVERDWVRARAWLRREMDPAGGSLPARSSEVPS